MADVSAPASDHAVASQPSAVALALVVMAIGGAILIDAASGLANPGYAQVGPGVFPAIFGISLTLAGACLMTQAIRCRWRVDWIGPNDDPQASAGIHESADQDAAPEPDRTVESVAARKAPLRVLLIAGALALNVFLFQPLGFVAASAILFACVAAAFDSRRHLCDALLGIGLGTAIYLIFSHGLGLSLPSGSVWEGHLWRP